MFFSSQGTNPGVSATQYFGSQIGTSAQEGFVRFVVPITSTATIMHIRVGATVTGTYTFTLVQNGSTTGITCNVASGTTCDATGSVAFTAGDTISIQSVTDGETNTGKAFTGSVLLQAPIPLPIFQFATEASVQNVTEYFTYNVNPTEASISMPSPIAGNATNFYCAQNNTLVGTDAFTLMIAGSASTMTCSNSPCNDLTHTPAISVGDTLSVKYTGASLGANNRVYCSFQVQ
jgi:hypothetical protein